MPTNYKFSILTPQEFRIKLLALGFKHLNTKDILDIYLDSKTDETIKLRIEDNKKCRLVHFERNPNGELIVYPNHLFKNIPDALIYIANNHKETKRLQKTLDTYTHETTSLCIHTFNLKPILYFLSIEDHCENKILELLKELSINSYDRIEKSFDQIVDCS